MNNCPHILLFEVDSGGPHGRVRGCSSSLPLPVLGPAGQGRADDGRYGGQGDQRGQGASQTEKEEKEDISMVARK